MIKAIFVFLISGAAGAAIGYTIEKIRHHRTLNAARHLKILTELQQISHGIKKLQSGLLK